MKEELAIVVVGFDGYKKLWDVFFDLFEKNWSDCPYSKYLITNEEVYIRKNVNVITTSKDAEWSTKVLKLCEEIPSKYICLLLEDFFVSDRISNSKIADMMKLIYTEEIKYLKMPYKGQFAKKGHLQYKNKKDYFYIYQDEKYNLTLLPSIWEKGFLREKVGKGNYSPWQFEIDRMDESKNKPHIVYKKCLETNSNPLNILNGVVQGELLPDTIKALERKGYTINDIGFSKMSYKKFFFLRLKTWGLFYIPQGLQNPIKKILSCFNVKFVSETRKKR